MRKVHLILALSVAAVAMPAAIFAGTRIRPIHPERLKLSPAARYDEVLKDLKTVLSGPATPTSIATRAYPASQPKLCRRDVVGISYVTEGQAWDAPVKPEGISGVGTQFYYLGEDGPKSLDALRKACARYSDTDLHWVSSNDGDHFASFALAILPQAIEDVRRGGDVSLTCEDVEDECDAKLFLTIASQVGATWRCAGNVQNCYRYGTVRYDVTVTLEYPGNGRHTIIKIEPVPILVS